MKRKWRGFERGFGGIDPKDVQIVLYFDGGYIGF